MIYRRYVCRLCKINWITKGVHCKRCEGDDFWRIRLLERETKITHVRGWTSRDNYLWRIYSKTNRKWVEQTRKHTKKLLKKIKIYIE